MSSIFGSAFAIVFAFLGIGAYPTAHNDLWSISQNWKPAGSGFQLVMSSANAVDYCKAHPNLYLIFPQVIHSYHEFFLDGQQIGAHGDKDFHRATSFYERPSLKCETLKAGTKLEWQVTTYSRFFARVSEWPSFTENPNIQNFFAVTLNEIAFGILFVLSIFSLLIYKKRVSDQLTYSVFFGSLLLSGYFLNCVHDRFGFSLSMLNAHKMADTCLWLGGFLFLNGFRLDKLFNSQMNLIFRISVIAGVIMIITGSDGDQVQFGTMIPMAPFFVCSMTIIYNLISRLREDGFTFAAALKFSSIFFFSLFGLNDALNVMGLIHTEMFLPVGCILGVFGLSVAVNSVIEHTYQERDSLLENLEMKVHEKTKHLEEALRQLKSTQAELVQSARLASLGTLSAGIAHEINNSINYVNGALVPLEKKINKLVAAEDRVMIDKLFTAIKEGTSLTVDIVRSLRNFTGLNQAEYKSVNLHQVVTSILTILKSKTRSVDVKVQITDEIEIFGNVTGLNQVFMNLISNSLDALDKDEKVISLECVDKGSSVLLAVEDNGSGMSQKVIDRIFDPFFTTKEVGKGTGLGLHIVAKEIEKHGGKISVKSFEGKGTRFEIELPKNSQGLEQGLESPQIRSAA